MGKNSLVIISSDGWCYIYEALHDSLSSSFEDLTVCDAEAKEVTDEIDGQGPSSSNLPTSSEAHSSADGEPTLCEQRTPVKNNLKNPLVCVHKQRIHADVKVCVFYIFSYQLLPICFILLLWFARNSWLVYLLYTGCCIFDGFTGYRNHFLR